MAPPASAVCRKYNCIKTISASYFLGGFYMETTSGTQALLNHYEINVAQNITFAVQTGLTTETVISATLDKIGAFVQLTIPAAVLFPISASPQTSILSGANIPARFRPAETELLTPCIITDNSTVQLGYLKVLATGVLQVHKPAAFTGSASATLHPISIGWTAAS